MNRLLVIGFGNMLRSDDGAGCVAAGEIARRYPGIDVLTAHELQPEFAETVCMYDCVWFIDATLAGIELTISEILPAPTPGPGGSHTLGPENLLALSQRLFGYAPKQAYVAAIPVGSTEIGDRLSTQTERMVGELVDRFDAFLRDFTAQQAPVVH